MDSRSCSEAISDIGWNWFGMFGIAGLTACVPLTRWLLDATLYKPLATIFIPLPPRVRGLLDLADTDADDEKIEASMLQAVKFRESLWKLSAYLASVIFGIHVIKGRNGTLIHPNLYWTGWPEISEAEVAPVLWYYTFQLAFYLASVGMLLAWEIRRRDAYVMMFHHLVSIAMMGTSIATGCQVSHRRLARIGGAVMLLHDVSDVLMESAKAAKYAGYETISLVAFVSFMISWAVLRLWTLPHVIVKMTWNGAVDQLGHWPPCFGYINAGLIVLQVMHVYWFYLIVRVAVRHLRGQGLVDEREE